MPVIPEPHVHLKAALDAIDEHEAHHEARIAHHEGEIAALEQLRAQYQDVLGQVAPDEPAPVVTAINIIEPGDPRSFDDLIATLPPGVL